MFDTNAFQMMDAPATQQVEQESAPVEDDSFEIDFSVFENSYDNRRTQVKNNKPTKNSRFFSFGRKK